MFETCNFFKVTIYYYSVSHVCILSVVEIGRYFRNYPSINFFDQAESIVTNVVNVDTFDCKNIYI